MSQQVNISQVLPSQGQLIFEEKKELVMCKPRLIPLKSLTLQKLENMQKQLKKDLVEPQN